MPTSPPRLCGQCRGIHSGRCPDAPRPAWTRADGSGYRGPSGHRRYRKLRQLILDETPLCRCGRLATEVDHRWPVEYGGPAYEGWNLQALCGDCHKRKTRRDRDGARRLVESVTPYTVVAGPPLAGKTTYVREHSRSGDLVLDLDEITAALVRPGSRMPRTGAYRDALHPFAVEMRNAALDVLARPSDVRHAWVITGAPRRVDRARFRGADVVVLPTPADTCLTRLRAGRRPADTADWIRAWWAAYEPE